MGINYAGFLLLAKMSRTFNPTGRSLMLGRQKFDLRAHRWTSRIQFSRALKKAGIDRPITDFAQPDRFSETMFRELGLGEIEALDASPFEGADVIHDLNEPIPDELRGQFDFVLDGGTLEHVFDVARALDNVVEMLAPGGRFVSLTPFNGWPGHGFYQFSPELVWSYWKSMQGFKVHSCLVTTPNGSYSRDLVNTRELGARIEFEIGPAFLGRLPARRLLMCYDVEKPTEAAASETKRPALQSDYENRWAAAEKPG